MIQKIDIIKMARHIVRRSSGRVDMRIMHPVRDWGVALLVAVLLFCGGGVYAGSTFLNELDVTDRVYTPKVDTASYDYDVIASVLSEYHIRVETFNALRADRRFVVIPPAVSTTTPETTTDEENVADNTPTGVE